MKGLILASLRNFEITNSKSINFKHFSIVPYDKIHKAKLFNSGLSHHIGILEHENMEANGWVVISEGTYEDGKFMPIWQFQKIVLDFCQFLWFIKDNSVHIEVCYSMFPLYGVMQFDSSYTNESILDSRGHGGITSFTPSEIRYCYKMLDKFYNLYPRQSISELLETQTNAKDPLHRIDRALSSLFDMRTTKYLPFKIALYGPILESLFSLDKEAISHKIAERIALYMEDSQDKQIETYDLIKSAYNVRSSYIHGEAIMDKNRQFENIANLSFKLDHIVRRILTKIIMEDAVQFSCSKNELEEFFKLLVFNGKNKLIT